MSAYRESSGVWPYRASITADALGWISGASDVSVPVPVDFDAFWNGINQTDGRDIRVTDASGNLLSFAIEKTGGGALDASAITSRDCTIKIDGSVTPTGGSSFTPPAASMVQLFVHWGNTSATAPTTGYVSISGALTGYLLMQVPQHVWVGRKARKDTTRLEEGIHKGTTESLVVAVDMQPMLQTRTTPFAGSKRGAEISYATYQVLQAGASQAAMVTAASLRFYAGRYVCMVVKAGTTATNYTISPTVVTTSSETLNPRAELRVRDLQES